MQIRIGSLVESIEFQTVHVRKITGIVFLLNAQLDINPPFTGNEIKINRHYPLEVAFSVEK